MIELGINFTVLAASSLKKYPDWVIFMSGAAPFILSFIYIGYKQLTTSAWEKGVFPSDLKYNKDNLLQAYICLSAWMLSADRRDMQDKIVYMNRYFKSHFGDRDFQESLNYAYKNPIDQRTISAWLNIHLNKSERSQIVHFLVGLSLVDGAIYVTERTVLNNLCHFINVSQKELEATIASYYQQRHRKREKSNSYSNSASSKKTALKLSYQVLGVSEYAGLDEIKKAYRSLVKKHHPDRFASNSPEHQKIAETRFVEIQKAYETIQKNK